MSSHSITAVNACSRQLDSVTNTEAAESVGRELAARKSKLLKVARQVPRKCECSTDAATGRGDIADVANSTVVASVVGGDGVAVAAPTKEENGVAAEVAGTAEGTGGEDRSRKAGAVQGQLLVEATSVKTEPRDALRIGLILDDALAEFGG